MNYWVLGGIAVMIGGFVLRLNALVVVVLAALVTGLAAGMDLAALISAFGKAFNQNRYVSVAWLILPAIGLLERSGLQERARLSIAALMLITYVPELVLWLPRQMGYQG